MDTPETSSSEENSTPRNLVEETLESWPNLDAEQKRELFRNLPREDEDEVFLRLPTSDQASILTDATAAQRRIWVRLLAPDDAADVVQELLVEDRGALVELLDPQTRIEVKALLAYREDVAGGLMSPRFARVRPEMSAEEAIRYLRAQTRANVETIYYAYILGNDQKLLGVVSLRELFEASHEKRVDEIMHRREDIITVTDQQDQEQVARIFSKWDFFALPVVDSLDRMQGIVTVDDVVSVVQQEASEDIQKFGGMEALDAPYLEIGILHMVKKRAGWLLILMIGEMFTATAMGYYEIQIQQAVVLALFIPLIISSGGNSGSQASTLIIRAMALGEVRIKDWWKVLMREMFSGLALGGVLGIVGFCRIFFWPSSADVYGSHYFLVALTVGFSLVGIVMWGSLAGSMLPFFLKKMKFDPATASAPFVATLVDVTGLVIYFTVASLILRGTLL